MIYVVVGPTCCGKTDAANKIAESLKCPIINADAFQIYKDMDVGTNKISKLYEFYNSYYMLDVITPDQSYSVKQYQDDARKILFELLKKNNDVVIVGGTGLYIKALLYDYSFNDEDCEIPDELLKMDNHSLHDLLNSLDSEEANKIHENNRKRLLRAITLIRNSNESKTEMLSRQEHKMIFDSKDIKFLYILPDRESLYKNINERVVAMMNNGLVEEVKKLLQKYQLSITATQGIGYKEVIDYLNNKLSYEDCISLIQQRTRNYAKRQITFFNHQFENINIFSSKEELFKNLKI